METVAAAVVIGAPILAAGVGSIGSFIRKYMRPGASDKKALDEEASDKKASDEEASDEEASDEEASDEEDSDEAHDRNLEEDYTFRPSNVVRPIVDHYDSCDFGVREHLEKIGSYKGKGKRKRRSTKGKGKRRATFSIIHKQFEGPSTSDDNVTSDKKDEVPGLSDESTADKQQRFDKLALDSIIKSEFDSTLFKRWVENGSLLEKIVQKCGISVDVFENCSYTTVSPTQSLKTLVTLVMILKSGIINKFPGIFFTMNNRREISRFGTSIDNFNSFVEEHVAKVVSENPDLKGMEIAKLRLCDDSQEMEGSLGKMRKEIDDRTGLSEIPIFIALANHVQASNSVSTICQKLCDYGFHGEVEVITTGEKVFRLRSIIVFDEADLLINTDIDIEKKCNEITKCIFVNKITVKLEDGTLISKPIFEMNSCTFEVTATPASLFFGKRDYSSRDKNDIIMFSLGKNAHQYERRSGMQDECKLISRRIGSAKDMIKSMFGDDYRHTHALVNDSATTTQKKNQTKEALVSALEHPGLITSAWCADSLMVAVECDATCVKDKIKTKSGDDGKFKFDVDKPGARPSREHKVLDSSFNIKSVTDTLPPWLRLRDTHVDGTCKNGLSQYAVEMFKIKDSGTEKWVSKAAIEDSVFSKFAKAAFKTLSEKKTKKEAMKIAREDPKAIDEVSNIIKGKLETRYVAVYVDKRISTGYPTFMSSLYTILNSKTNVVNFKIRTVLYAKDMAERGTTVKGSRHEGSLTHMYMNLTNHYTMIIQAAGRLAGLSYHECDGSCPDHEDGTVCPIDEKILWAPASVHTNHILALRCTSYLVGMVERGENCMQKITNLLGEMEKVLNQPGFSVNSLSPEDVEMYKVLCMLTGNVTGGDFSIENRCATIKKGMKRKEAPMLEYDNGSVTSVAKYCRRTDESGSGNRFYISQFMCSKNWEIYRPESYGTGQFDSLVQHLRVCCDYPNGPIVDISKGIPKGKELKQYLAVQFLMNGSIKAKRVGGVAGTEGAYNLIKVYDDMRRRMSMAEETISNGSLDMDVVEDVVEEEMSWLQSFRTLIGKLTADKVMSVTTGVDERFKDHLIQCCSVEEGPVSYESERMFLSKKDCLIVKVVDGRPISVTLKGSKVMILAEYETMCRNGLGGGSSSGVSESSLRMIDVKRVSEKGLLDKIVNVLKNGRDWVSNSDIIVEAGISGDDRGRTRSMMWNWYTNYGVPCTNDNAPGLYVKKFGGNRHYFKFVE